jgi:hypothetical protein
MAATDWSERIAPDEAQRFNALAAQLRALQQAKASAHGAKSRALHAKPHVGLTATLRVRDGLPDWARVGIFASPGTFQAWVRLSNGSTGHHSDKAPDVRGFALKVTGVPGQKLIPGMEDAPTQDFLAILTDSMPFKTPDAFVAVVRAANGPKLLALPRILAALGASAFSILPQLQKGMAERVDSLVERTFFSVLPIRWGATAVKYSFVPVNAPKPAQPVADGAAHFADDVRARVSHAPLIWTLRVQPFVSERETPIEDPTVRWPSLWTDVADVLIPIQDPQSPQGQTLGAAVEAFSFDPWHAPVEFRPLGAMMRARSAAYRDSTLERGAAREPGPTV